MPRIVYHHPVPPPTASPSLPEPTDLFDQNRAPCLTPESFQFSGLSESHCAQPIGLGFASGAMLWVACMEVCQPRLFSTQLNIFCFLPAICQSTTKQSTCDDMRLCGGAQLFSDALEACGLLTTASVGLLSGSCMWIFHAAIS